MAQEKGVQGGEREFQKKKQLIKFVHLLCVCAILRFHSLHALSGAIQLLPLKVAYRLQQLITRIWRRGGRDSAHFTRRQRLQFGQCRRCRRRRRRGSCCCCCWGSSCCCWCSRCCCCRCDKACCCCCSQAGGSQFHLQHDRLCRSH